MTTRVALVTGGIGGIGTAICQRLARDGYKVVASHHPSEQEKVEGLCWTRPLDAVRGRFEGGITDPRIMAAVLFLTMIVLYSILR